MTKKNRTSKLIPFILLATGSILLLLAQSSYWVNHSIFNQENFSKSTTNALLSDTSRKAIATAIVDTTLEDYPRVKRVIGERVISLTSGLLGSDLSTEVVSRLSNRTYAYMTSSDRKDIAIDLTAVKTVLGKLSTLAQTSGRTEEISVEKVPDEIVLLRKTDLPNFSRLVSIMLWLGPLLWLATLGVFGTYIYLGRSQYAKKVYTAGFVIIGVSLLGLLAGPFIPPPLSAAVPNIELRPVVQNLATEFLAPFNAQMWYLIFVTIIILAVFSQRFALLSFVRSAEKKLTKRN